MYEAVVVLGALWELAGMLAATHATAEDIEALRRIHLAASQAADRAEVTAFARHSQGFHAELARVSGNAYLARLTERVTQDAERGTVQLGTRRERLSEANRDHENLLDAIARRLPDRAGEILRWRVEDINSALGAVYGSDVSSTSSENHTISAS